MPGAVPVALVGAGGTVEVSDRREPAGVPGTPGRIEDTRSMCGSKIPPSVSNRQVTLDYRSLVGSGLYL